MVLLSSTSQAPRSINQGSVLLPIARASIARALGLEASAAETDSWLFELGASFVTLKENGEVRGCIGTLEARRALIEDVKENAVAAALRDPRFEPLTRTELEQVRIEVSVLSPLTPLQFADEGEALTRLLPGVHGVALEHGAFHSTFLPQVWKDLPDPVDFLANLKRKAGLPAEFWSAELKLRVYTVAKWKETQ
jgi:AmmeMemoRadiSam system protein A